jgi:hypothetical protein
MTIEVVLPADLAGDSRMSAAASHAWKRLPARPTVGMIDNTKTGAAEFLDTLGRCLVRRGVAGDYFVWKKASSNHRITAEERSVKLGRAHVIISGIGDCGSCTSCSLGDALSFSREGTPATVVVSTPFERLAKFTAATNGASGFEIMVVDHPVWTRDQAWMDAEAERLADRVVSVLFAPAEAS